MKNTPIFTTPKTALQLCLSALIVLTSIGLKAQNPEWNSAQIRHEMEKLAVTANVLYLAAHPDDENTRLISRLANEEKVRTAYLSLTRGDGGQNLIGDEKGALLGLIRTQELLEARKVDGGEQYFTRALDFGFSKTHEETLEKWNRDSVLKDVVHVIRYFKPDIIITRFPANNYGGHGHHSAASILAAEAYEIAADEKAFPESSKKYGPWQTPKLYFNASTWWKKEIEDHPEEYHLTNVGIYNELLGQPYTVMAAESRSRHRSQGFGALRPRGNQLEYLELLKGSDQKTEPLFENIITDWSRVEGGKKIQKRIDELLKNYDHTAPQKSTDALAQLYFEVENMPDNRFKKYKLQQIKDLYTACAGLYFEYLSEVPYATTGAQVAVRAEAISQLDNPHTLKSVSIHGIKRDVTQILSNEKSTVKESVVISNEITPPYWLWSEPQNNMFPFSNRDWIGLAENPAVSKATFTMETKYGELEFDRDLRYKWRSRKDGELYRPFAVIPKVSMSCDQKTILFTDENPKEVTVKIKTYDADAGELVVKPDLPRGWRSEPEEYKIDKMPADEVKFRTFTLFPSAKQNQFDLKFTINGQDARDLVEVKYIHIETQTVMPKTKVTLVSAPIEVRGRKVGYFEGSGDEVPAALKQLGYEVEFLDPARTTRDDLMKYDAVIAGIRAYNTNPEMYDLNDALNAYVEAGGNYVVQYNTSFGLPEGKNIGPYPFRVSRDRVTVEEAPVAFLDRDHPLMNMPNKLEVKDFDGWVQERGLYFPDEWSNQFIPLFAWNDPGEDIKRGSLITARHGKGRFTYTGISFFRQLPAGVPGAFRLFANIVANEMNVDKEK